MYIILQKRFSWILIKFFLLKKSPVNLLKQTPNIPQVMI